MMNYRIAGKSRPEKWPNLTERCPVKNVRGLVMFLTLLALVSGCQKKEGTSADGDNSLQLVQRRGQLLWGADVVGGIPYVYEDPARPGTYIGFEMEIAESIARRLGVKAQLVIKPWDTLIPELQRGSFDLAMNGIENTEDRAKLVLFSDPYFVYSQQITVRKDTKDVATMDDLMGRKVATLSGTAAEDLLRARPGIQVQTNPEIIYSYRDLEEGKVDAVVLDTPIAAAYAAPNPNLRNVGQSFGEGHYVIAYRSEDNHLRTAVNQALLAMKESGELAAILRKYNIMDDHQASIGVRE